MASLATWRARRSIPPAAAGARSKYRVFLEEIFADDIRALRERFGLSWP